MVVWFPRARPRLKLTSRNFSNSNLIILFLAKLPVLVLLVLVVISVSILLRGGYLKVKETRVFLDGEVFSATHLSDFVEERLFGRNIFLFSGNDFGQEVKRNFLSLVNVRVTKRFPGRVEVFAESRRPVGLLLIFPESEAEASPSAILRSVSEKFQSSTQVYVFDSTGLVFAKVDRRKLPILRLAAARVVGLGEVLRNPLEHFEIDLIGRLKEAEFSTYLVAVAGSDALTFLEDGTLFLFSVKKSPVSQVSVAKMIQEKYRIEGKKIAKIDLRFKNPVVEFR